MRKIRSANPILTKLQACSGFAVSEQNKGFYCFKRPEYVEKEILHTPPVLSAHLVQRVGDLAK